MTITHSPEQHAATERIAFARTPISAAAPAAVAEVLRSGWLTTGPQVAAFEREFASFADAEHAVAVASCTTALELSLRALRLPVGAPVLTSTVTFCGAVNAILHAGLRPLLVDIDRETLMPSPETVAAAVRRGVPPSAAVVLHFAGYPAPVAELAEAAGLPIDRVIEDAAHAIGTRVGARPVGGLSAAACFSFYATKNLPIGEGGMVTTNDGELADAVRRGRLHGMSKDAWKRYAPGNSWRYSVDELGLKANMTDLQAAIGLAQLPEVPRWQARREELVAHYDELLADVPGLVRPARPDSGRHSWHLYVVRVTPEFGIGRDELIMRLAEVGVDCSVHFIPMHQQPYLQTLPDVHPRHFPVAEAAFEQYVSLPLYPDLTDAQVDRVCTEIAAAPYR
jgi:dTDP-4-amino-4,6-dideoxygalactose transaminase